MPDRPLHLAYVVNRFPKLSETFVFREVWELLRRGERVTVLARLPAEPLRSALPGGDGPVPLVRAIPLGPGRPLRLVASLLGWFLRAPRRTLAALGWSIRHGWRGHPTSFHHLFEAAYLARRLPAAVDHVHAHFAHSPTSVALFVSRLTGRPFSFTGHAVDIFRNTPAKLLSAKAAEASFVVAVSEHTARYLREIVRPADRGKVVVVRSGVDPDTFSARASEPAGVPVLLSVARLVEKKGLDTLVESAALLAHRGVEFRCRVIGEGPLRTDLEGLARRLGVSDRVHLQGAGDQEEVRRALDGATVFVLPCREAGDGDRDALPVSILEAMSVGVPVVTTPISGIAEAVRDGVSGLLVPPANPWALADAIERVLVDAALRARLVAGGREAVRGFRLEDSVAHLRALFRGGPGAPVREAVG